MQEQPCKDLLRTGWSWGSGTPDIQPIGDIDGVIGARLRCTAEIGAACGSLLSKCRPHTEVIARAGAAMNGGDRKRPAAPDLPGAGTSAALRRRKTINDGAGTEKARRPGDLLEIGLLASGWELVLGIRVCCAEIVR